ncbi:hypothetical protein EKH57_12515 [Halorubrum sp. BOL3-1]|uniref:hypothetical protein n=1 Tax=Halorubrum sp. BOL3-1 TaxID=2497325 RepID=UPI001004F4F9|nr:hypothetical protein [Halorubrum sp. BOL3-1]QAU13469.1 hypothetical protein EKH57_12515 [Halorubrum sp. BOL3-1]
MSEPTLDLETVIRRDRPPEMRGNVQIDTVDNDTRVTLSVGDDRAIRYVLLSPAEATQLASALETAAETAADSMEEHPNE